MRPFKVVTFSVSLTAAVLGGMYVRNMPPEKRMEVMQAIVQQAKAAKAGDFTLQSGAKTLKVDLQKYAALQPHEGTPKWTILPRRGVTTRTPEPEPDVTAIE